MAEFVVYRIGGLPIRAARIELGIDNPSDSPLAVVAASIILGEPSFAFQTFVAPYT